MLITDSLLCIAAYLLGSLPFGMLIGYAFGAGDIRRLGSGNIGATNVLRSVGKGAAVLALLGDSGKGAAAVAIAYSLDKSTGFAACIALIAVIGHNFPLWLRFKGGKGVATALGALAVVSWPLGLTLGALWLIMFGLFRISSLAALTTFALLPIVIAFMNITAAYPDILWLTAGMALSVLIFVRHKDNIKRLMRGEEKPIRFKNF